MGNKIFALKKKKMNCEEIRQKVGIRKVLESFNLFPIRENKRTAFYFALDREEKIPSLSVDFIRNRAFDFGTGKSYDVISIVQQMHQCSVSEALKYLSGFDYSVQDEIKNREPKIHDQNGYKILQVKEIEHPALIQYLEYRKVVQQKHRVKEVRYELNKKKYFGIGFKNDSEGFEIRNVYSKLCLGKKDITFFQNENNLKKKIAVFEGFFDYLTFRNLVTENSNFDYLILNSTAMFFKAEEKLREYGKIFLFLDNDANGKSVKSKVMNRYKNVEDCSLIYHNFKDLNEWYCKEK